MRILFSLLIVLACTACVPETRQAHKPRTQGIDFLVSTYDEKYGVICYSKSFDSLFCVKVDER